MQFLRDQFYDHEASTFFTYDIFLVITNSFLVKYAEDNTLYAFDKDHNKVKIKLTEDLESFEDRFKLNRSVLNPKINVSLYCNSYVNRK